MPSVPRVVEIARIVELVRKGEPMRRRLLSGLGVFTIACVAAGCGSSNGGLPSNGVASKSPIQILHAAVGAMKSAKSVYIAGSQTTAGKTVGIDATIFSNGDIDGSVTEDASNIGVVKIGGTDYIKATGAFYKADGATAKIAGLMGGKWVKLPDSQAGFGNQFSLVALANSIQSHNATMKAGSTSTLNGEPVVSIVASNGGVLYIATTGPAYPLKATNTSQKVGGTLTFTQWNQGKPPTAPAGARTPESFGLG
jgi:hypothetical protein